MELLVLGGTQFVGRHLVEAALARDWRVTLFNRGQTNTDLFPEAEKLRGDRDPQISPGLSALLGRRWDVVVDCNGYVPRLVRAAAEALRDAVGQYIFISTGSVYDFNQLQGEDDESAPLLTLKDPTTEEWFGPAYGGLKVLCEEAVAEIYGERALSLRLGIVAGPNDPTDRITYWVARGGDALAFGSPRNADAIHRCARPGGIHLALGRAALPRRLQHHRRLHPMGAFPAQHPASHARAHELPLAC